MKRQIRTTRLWPIVLLTATSILVGCARSLVTPTMSPATPSQASATLAPPTATPAPSSVSAAPTATVRATPTERPTPKPTPTPHVYPTPEPGTTPVFDLGGHIRTWNYVDQMKYTGMTWAKQQIHYPDDGAEIISKAHDLGFKIQLSAIGSAEFVLHDGFVDTYTAWVADLAAAGADAVEVWNEPNIDREWPRGAISAEDYTELLCSAYAAIKAANPETVVISAAPAPTGYFGGCSPDGCDDIPFLEGMISAGAAECLDYVGAHYAAGATPPDARQGHPADPSSTHHSWFFLPQTELYFDLFEGKRQLFYTELGYASQEGVPQFSDVFAWARDTDNEEQAAWLSEAVQLSIDTGTVHAIMVWNVDFKRYGLDPQDGYAIIRPDGSCPSCEALHATLFANAATADSP